MGLQGVPVFDGDRTRDDLTVPLGFTTVLVPTSSLRIERTWDAAGLRGTGSQTMAAEEVFVPAQFLDVESVAADVARPGGRDSPGRADRVYGG